MTVLQPVAHWPKIDHAQAAGVWRTVAANVNLIFITIGAFKYPILTIIASPIFADFQYVVYKYFTQIINVTDILLQFFWGRILYSLDYICTWKALLALTLFGMYFKQIDNIWAKVCETSCSLCIDSKELEGFPIQVDENKTELLLVTSGHPFTTR